MIPNYRTITITADSNENIMPLIYEELKANGYKTSDFVLKFIGFEADAGTAFKINGNPLKVPLNGKFYTPYGGEDNTMLIRKVSFDEGCSGLDLWIIY